MDKVKDFRKVSGRFMRLFLFTVQRNLLPRGYQKLLTLCENNSYFIMLPTMFCGVINSLCRDFGLGFTRKKKCFRFKSWKSKLILIPYCYFISR